MSLHSCRARPRRGCDATWRTGSGNRIPQSKAMSDFHGALAHHWHGPSSSRGYEKRWSIASFHQFDPETDLIDDPSNGMLRWAGNKPQLEQDMRMSLSLRNEDARLNTPLAVYLSVLQFWTRRKALGKREAMREKARIRAAANRFRIPLRNDWFRGPGNTKFEGKEENNPNMIKLSWWEEFIVQAAISLLTLLASKVTNQTELAGIQAAIVFLQRLIAGQVNTA